MYGMSFDFEAEKKTKTRRIQIQRNASTGRAAQAARLRPGQTDFRRGRSGVHGRKPPAITATKYQGGPGR